MMHLLQRAVSNGLNLHTGTHIQSIAPRGKEWSAASTRGTITAKKVIFATNGYTAGPLPEYKSKIVPAKGICCSIITPSGSKPPQLKETYVLRLGNGSGDYLISRDDGRIIVGGGRSSFFSDYPTWYDNIDDYTLIKPAANYFDTYMQTNFVGWEDSGAEVEHIWTGIMGYNSDKLPSVGKVPGKEGCFIAAGFEGHGMPVIWLVMKGIAGEEKGWFGSCDGTYNQQPGKTAS